MTSWKPDYIIADHGDDVYFVFGMSSMETFMDRPVQYKFDEDSVKVENMVTQYFSSFAKTGFVFCFFFCFVLFLFLFLL